ncbi:hypothetical protein [Butyricimonas paravirosa]|jgi:hypothetical protein|uniref:hypothetical protein n=1 Tax=Butyricimonas paravirosa TaxID=1472417 RepID=UPI0022E86F1C|nr:hypothetical protein [Butyricimonas paravirosa]
MNENETQEQEKNTLDQPEKIEGKKGKTKVELLVERYAKAYPREKVFHVTSDMQVFLSRDKNLAELHQKSLEKDEKIQTIKVK